MQPRQSAVDRREVLIDDRLALLFKKWRITSRRFSYDVAQFMVNFGLFDRATLARPGDEGTIVLEVAQAAVPVAA